MTITIDTERYLRLSVAARSESLPKRLKAAMEDLKAIVPFDLERFEAQKGQLIADLEAFQSEVTELRRIRAAQQIGGTVRRG